MVFQIEPLQIPRAPAPARLDFSPLDQIGTAFAERQRKQAVADILAGATDQNGALNFDKAGAALAAAGLTEDARPMLELATRKAALAQSATAHADTVKYQNASLAETSRHNAALEEAQRRAFYEGRVPAGFRVGEGGKFEVIPGGPQDPAYLASVNEAKDRTIAAQNDERRKAVVAAGADPNDPRYRDFILSGRMPREEQLPLTATDKKIIEGADDAVLAANNAIESLRRAKELSGSAYGGPYAGARGYVSSLFGSQAGEATTNLTNEVTTNALGQLKAIFGGNPTEGERKIMLDMQGSVNQPDNVRQSIFDRAIALAQKRLDFNQRRANELRGGTFYKPKTPEPSPGPRAEPTAGEPSENAIMKARANPAATANEARAIVAADPSKAGAVRKLLERAGIDPKLAGFE